MLDNNFNATKKNQRWFASFELQHTGPQRTIESFQQKNITSKIVLLTKAGTVISKASIKGKYNVIDY